MSITIDIFAAAPATVESCRQFIEGELGIVFNFQPDATPPLYESEWNGWTLLIFDEHGLEDDKGIAFSDYPIEISFGGRSYLPDICELVERLGKALAVKLQCKTMAVYDVQRLVGVFEPKQLA